MPPKSVFQKKYGSKNKQGAARAAVAAARASLIASRRGPSAATVRAGGFGPRFPGELKAIDVVPSSSTCVLTTAGITLLNGVATGTDFTNRIGRKITMKSLFIRGWLQGQDIQNGSPLGNLCRIMVVYDKQPNGAALTGLQVLKTIDAADQLNLDNRDRFSVLVDKTVALGTITNVATQAVAGSPTCRAIKIYKRLNLDVQFIGTDATVASIQTGSLYLLTCGSQATSDGHTFYFSSRVRFTDN